MLLEEIFTTKKIRKQNIQRIGFTQMVSYKIWKENRSEFIVTTTKN